MSKFNYVHLDDQIEVKVGKEFNTEWIFFFLHLIIFFKALTDLEFLISTVRLVHLFMQYGKKVFLKGFVLDKEGLIAEADMDLKVFI